MFRSSFQEERVAKDSKLQAVFSKLAAVLPGAEDLGNNNPKTMSSDIIESVLADAPVPTPTDWNHHDVFSCSGVEDVAAADVDCLAVAVASLARRIEAELRSAKRTHLSCGEVLLPCGLLQRIAADIVAMAESEPCGLRGCKLYLLFETTRHCIRLGTVQCDVATAATFELYLTLKQSSTGWQFLPQFISAKLFCLERSGKLDKMCKIL
ncbi:hypothetical protein NQ315_015999 [Exocentrus adspersus]|uniref:Uncharacterized protein n=1 Tax=Exocentrus adspersus TaxID=1586481 RepID=A0AAV8VLM4_9CUCU|nr:hypothetical protein NQ315_015999 [Exocentrus adspersus]